MRIGKKLTKIRCYITHNGFKKAEILKHSGIFQSFGEGCFWHPRILPSETEKVIIGNNVSVATDVYFCTHDLSHVVFNNITELVDTINSGKPYTWQTGNIEIKDNVFIGAHSRIKYGITIGPNAIVAMGSVVTKDVPQNSIVGGNPAKVIGYFDEYAKKISHK